MKKIRTLVVDDSALMRGILTEVLSQDPEIEVIGTAGDPHIAKRKVLDLQPDVITLDIAMPKMDGLVFLERLMSARPMPVVMVSALTMAGCETTLRALELGAVDFVSKPQSDIEYGLRELAEEIVRKVKIAAGSRPRLLRKLNRKQDVPPVKSAPVDVVATPTVPTQRRFILVGASTGGTQALTEILPRFPTNAPATLVVIHMPENFTKSFAARLDRMCEISVKEAVDGDRVLPGQALIAPGNLHMEIAREGAFHVVRTQAHAPVNRHRPSVDVLFDSGAAAIAKQSVAVLLTGMGADGAAGLLKLKQQGAHTIAQDEDSSIVFGMPREAIALGAANQVLPLDRIARAALKACEA